jgi:hypothetical protein
MKVPFIALQGVGIGWVWWGDGMPGLGAGSGAPLGAILHATESQPPLIGGLFRSCFH